MIDATAATTWVIVAYQSFGIDAAIEEMQRTLDRVRAETREEIYG